MHGKPITGSYQRTPCGSVKTMSGLVGAAFITSDGSLIPSARYARVEAEGQVLRYTLDGSTPTATAGHRLLVGATKTFSQAEMRAINVLEETAGGFANVTLFSS